MPKNSRVKSDNDFISVSLEMPQKVLKAPLSSRFLEIRRTFRTF